MKKVYYYWLDDQPYFNFNDPLSAMSYGNSKQAKAWAKKLLKSHPRATYCKFRMETGTKEYTITLDKK